LFKEIRKNKEIKVFKNILFFYGFWIIFSGIMHYIALSTLDPFTTYITVRKQKVAWGLQMVKILTSIYFLFPLLFFVAINLFKAYNDRHKKLYLLPALMIPSLIFALYQAFIDIDFLNNPFFANDNRVSGLCGDANGLGISIFILFPLCFLAILDIRKLWKKFFFGLLSVILLWCLLLSGSRTGLFGIIIFITFSPLLLIYGNPDRFKGWYKVLILSAPIFTLLLISIGLVAFERDFHLPAILMKRMNSTYFDFKEGGMGRVIKVSGRSELWLQACRLTILSPLSGWGPGGFYHNLDNIRFKNGENSKMIDNADNYYLQLSSDLGLLGASFNLFLHLMPLWMVFRIRKKIQDQEELAIRICFAIVSIMMVLYLVMPNTIGITPMFILVILLAFLFVTALKYGYSFDRINTKVFWSSLAVLTILFVLGTYDTTFGHNGYKAMQQASWWPFKYTRNCYAIEDWEEGFVRWCKKDAFLRIPIRSKLLPKKIKLIFSARHPDIQSKPVIVKFGGKAGVKHEAVVKDTAWKMIELPVTGDNIYEFKPPNKPVRRFLVLSIDVSRTWIPKECGVNQDTRELGIVILLSPQLADLKEKHKATCYLFCHQ
jgi:O-antigen ligase